MVLGPPKTVSEPTQNDLHSGHRLYLPRENATGNIKTLLVNSQSYNCRPQIQDVVAPERERVGKVLHVKVVDFVALALEGQHGVGAEPNAAIHPWSEVNSEERKARVRNLQHKSQ